MLWLMIYTGCKLIFLPSYSPDYNPIEQAFLLIKSFLWHHWQDTSLGVMDCVCQNITSDKAAGYFRASGYIVWRQRCVLSATCIEIGCCQSEMGWDTVNLSWTTVLRSVQLPQLKQTLAELWPSHYRPHKRTKPPPVTHLVWLQDHHLFP